MQLTVQKRSLSLSAFVSSSLSNIGPGGAESALRTNCCRAMYSTQLLPGNVFVQPQNRGTAIGVAYSLMQILSKDPRAKVLLLPADHYVREERILSEALRSALDRLEHDDDHVVLLGFEPEEADTELGYILPGADDPLGGRSVEQFVEKPAANLVAEIIRHDGLWNAFIVASSAGKLLQLFSPRHAMLLVEMQAIVSNYLRPRALADGWPTIAGLYQRLPSLDFSRHVLEGQEASLRVMRVPPCGWSDLGTPGRVGKALWRLGPRARAAASGSTSAYLNLAAQHARLGLVHSRHSY
jgi:mannose-1-phosphate guanylyltransferase